eukprot:SAG22_NODE_260_length_13403_cov_57.915589_11_plen_241_part_00
MVSMLAAFARVGDPSTAEFAWPAFRPPAAVAAAALPDGQAGGGDSACVVLGAPDCQPTILIERDVDAGAAAGDSGQATTAVAGSRIRAQRQAWKGLWARAAPPTDAERESERQRLAAEAARVAAEREAARLARAAKEAERIRKRKEAAWRATLEPWELEELEEQEAQEAEEKERARRAAMDPAELAELEEDERFEAEEQALKLRQQQEAEAAAAAEQRAGEEGEEDDNDDEEYETETEED